MLSSLRTTGSCPGGSAYPGGARVQSAVLSASAQGTASLNLSVRNSGRPGLQYGCSQVLGNGERFPRQGQTFCVQPEDQTKLNSRGMGTRPELIPPGQPRVPGFIAAISSTAPVSDGVSQADFSHWPVPKPTGNPSDILDLATLPSCLLAASYDTLVAELAHPCC